MITLKYAIQNNSQLKSKKIARKLIDSLSALGFQQDQIAPEIVITIGGDGTLLSAFHRHAHRLDECRFIGVHTGHLGFYTDWREYQLDELIESLKNDRGEDVSYPLLDIEVFYRDVNEPSHHFLALNEATVKRVEGTIACDVFIDDEPFEKFRGDGLCIATPTGSTGYNKSLGGAVLHPDIEALQMTEIASINNRVFRTISAPLITAKDEKIVLMPTYHDQFILTVDHVVIQEETVDRVEFKIAKERIHFAKYKHLHFWNRVNDAFIGDSLDD